MRGYMSTAIVLSAKLGVYACAGIRGGCTRQRLRRAARQQARTAVGVFQPQRIVCSAISSEATTVPGRRGPPSSNSSVYTMPRIMRATWGLPGSSAQRRGRPSTDFAGRLSPRRRSLHLVLLPPRPSQAHIHGFASLLSTSSPAQRTQIRLSGLGRAHIGRVPPARQPKASPEQSPSRQATMLTDLSRAAGAIIDAADADIAAHERRAADAEPPWDGAWRAARASACLGG